MNCPTCGFPLTHVRLGIHRCGECGTLTDAADGAGKHYIPALVGRCREFESGNLYTNNDGRRIAQWLRDVGRYLRPNTKAPGGTPP